jgi:type I restriction enzyme S subunit
MQIKQQQIKKIISDLCPDGVVFDELANITIWDKRFNGVCKIRQPKTVNFKHVSAVDLKKLKKDEGDVKLLSTGKFDGWTTKELAGKNLNHCEIITIPSGGSANLKYYNGYFVDSGNILAIAKNESINLKYVYYYLLIQNNKIQDAFRGSGVKHPNMSEILKIKIPVPPLEIQQEIVSILDTFTELEAELEAELETRKKQYVYYRDSLLYIKNVEYKTLGEVGTFIRGNGLQKKDFTENGVGCIHYGQIYTYYGTFADKTKTFVSPELAKKLKKAQKGDVLIAGVSENVADVCKPLGWLGDEICISGDMFAFRHNQNTKFITYLLQTTNFNKYKEKYAQGAKVTRVKADKILGYKIPVPGLEEQNRIVAILDKFDALVNDMSIGLPAELAARRKQYEYYRNKLLTFKELNK